MLQGVFQDGQKQDVQHPWYSGLLRTPERVSLFNWQSASFRYYNHQDE